MLQSGDFDLIVLDELLTAVTFKLIKPEELWELLDEAPKNCEVVLTGRCEDEALLARADLVSQVCKIRHYYDKGVQARPGIEY